MSGRLLSSIVIITCVAFYMLWAVPCVVSVARELPALLHYPLIWLAFLGSVCLVAGFLVGGLVAALRPSLVIRALRRYFLKSLAIFAIMSLVFPLAALNVVARNGAVPSAELGTYVVVFVPVAPLFLLVPLLCVILFVANKEHQNKRNE